MEEGRAGSGGPAVGVVEADCWAIGEEGKEVGEIGWWVARERGDYIGETTAWSCNKWILNGELSSSKKSYEVGDKVCICERGKEFSSNHTCRAMIILRLDKS